MADELKFEESLRSDYPDQVVEHPPKALPEAQSKAEFMCDRNFEESQRQRILKSAAILQDQFENLDVTTLKQQDPLVVFWTVWSAVRTEEPKVKLPIVRANENEAIEKTIKWFVKNFDKFNVVKELEDGQKVAIYPAHYSLMDCLVAWINSNLRERLKDLRKRKRGQDGDFYYRDRQVINPNTKKEETIRERRNIGEGAIVGDDGEILTLLELLDENRQINLPKSRSSIHSGLEKLAAAETTQTCLEIEQLIINDPDGKLRAMCIDGNPLWDCQEILYRKHILHEKQSKIAEDLGADNDAIERKLRDHAYPYLGAYALSHGYEPATTRKAVLANPNKILTKTKMKDAKGKSNCPEANAYYLAQQFLTDFDKNRSTEDVTRELVNKYQYNITVEMVQEFWEEEGKPAVAKAIRLYNVKKRPKKDQQPDS
ncbi:MAG: hypothetical protein NW214_09580 [Pseudanabaenaceae cyanobacterium bins.39]|nr:hypothetical protein [Pseudanabaenaceae cyanobacterium bins.39]